MGSNLTKPAAARWRASFDGRTSIVADAATALNPRGTDGTLAPTTDVDRGMGRYGCGSDNVAAAHADGNDRADSGQWS